MPSKGYKKVTKELIEDDLKRLYKELNRIPSTNDYKKLGLYGLTTIRYTCGWNETLLNVFGRVLHEEQPRIEKKCPVCNKIFMQLASYVKRAKISFCSVKCQHLGRHLIKCGCNRSKLEIYLEKELKTLYPLLEIHYNQTDTIKAELDIYIPSLKLAFEINGPFHYEPIFGEEKLKAMQNNDQRKFQACLERGIELCIIDSSRLKYFKEANAKPFLDIVVNIINTKTKTT